MGSRPAIVNWDREGSTCSRLTKFSRFVREEEEMERLYVLTSNMSRFLLVMLASMEIRMWIRLAIVRPNGRATQTNFPAPIVMALLSNNSIRLV